MSAPFSRFKNLMSVIAAAIVAGMSQREAYSTHIYTSNGKGEGKSNRSPGGANGAFKRAANKKRNQAAHRRACR